MRSDDATLAAAPSSGTVYRLLDSAFGFGIWAVHLLAIYVSTAVACQLRLPVERADVRSSAVIALIAVTLLAAAIVAAHAIRRYRQQRDSREGDFLARLAVGDDAVALVGILWQLIPITMVPLCR